jgi:rubrerythrin
LWENTTEGVIKMEMNTRDTIMKKLLDAQENVRDYQSFAREVSEEEVSNTFRDFAEQSAMQAQKLQELLNTHDGK